MRLMLDRLAALPLVLLGLSALSFLLLASVPGDPVSAMLGPDADPQAIARLRIAYALDQPGYVRFLAWLGHVAGGDFGRSIQTGRPVLATVLAALGPTLELTGMAVLLSLVLAVPAGVLAAVRQGGAFDAAVSVLSLIGLSLPGFWVGVLLILGLSVHLGWLPSSGHAGLVQAPVDALRHLVLPALTLGIALAGATLRMVRSAVLEVLPAEHVRTAHAKGLAGHRVLGRHVLRLALAPVVTLLGLQLGQMLGGVVVTETVFAWPGIGKLLVDAIFARDYPLVQGTLMVTATLFVGITLATDLLLVALDPRQRAPA